MRLMQWLVLGLLVVLSGCAAADVTPEASVAAFAAANLAAANITTTDVLPTMIANGLASCSGVRFAVEGDKGARVIICSERTQADGLATYYRELGAASPLLFSHVHQDGKLVLQMNGELPAELFAQYVAALP
jgi:methyl coenzyme M reductase alpha subunit